MANYIRTEEHKQIMKEALAKVKDKIRNSHIGNQNAVSRKDLREKIKEIILLYQEGKSASELSKQFNTTHNTILNLLRRNKVEIREQKFYILGEKNPNYKDIPKNKIIEAYANGDYISDLAKEYNCSVSNIGNLLKKEGIQIIRKKPKEETRKKMSEARKKLMKENPSLREDCIKRLKGAWVGKKHSIKTKQLLREINIGRKMSEKSKLKMKESWDYQKHFTEDIKKKMGKTQSIIKKGKGNPMYGKTKELCPSWLGGKSFEPYGEEFNLKLKNLIRKRDNQVCMNCGVHREKLSKSLSIHHINYDKKCNIEQNLISLCVSCHTFTNTNRDYWQKLFQEKLTKLYNYQYDEKGNVIINLKGEKDGPN